MRALSSAPASASAAGLADGQRDAVIHTKDLTKVYQGTDFAAVDKLNIDVEAGEIWLVAMAKVLSGAAQGILSAAIVLPMALVVHARRCGHRPAVNIMVCDIIVCMAQVDRFSVTMPPDLGEDVRRAAERQGVSVSAWLSEAAADRLRNELLGAALDAWESEDGSFTDAELTAAASRLGLTPSPDVA
jgi:hypothetical protein